jgi:hypothetical protein
LTNSIHQQIFQTQHFSPPIHHSSFKKLLNQPNFAS